jgi:UDP-N-acetylmuramoyl-tripeptide--D-alanyl-D-alanine ligase
VFNLKDIVQALTNKKAAYLDVEISEAVIDSRQAKRDSLFIAFPGERTDGHVFVQEAFYKGAVLALVQQKMPDELNTLDLRPDHFNPEQSDLSLPLCLRVENTLSALQTLAAYWRSKHPVRTIGITGSVGKTTTKELTAALLSEKYKVLKNPGNQNNEIGLPLSILGLEDDHQYAVLEMGFYVPGEIRTLCEIAEPQVGVVTNVGTVHAERAGSQEIIARGKAELVESLPAAPEGIAILNHDDPWVKKMADKTKASVFYYGIHQKADLRAADIISHGLNGLSLNLQYQGEQHQVHSPLMGNFSAYTILRAVAVALNEGIGWEIIEAGLAAKQIDLRMRQFSLSNGAIVLDDTYNASPESTIAALELLSKLEGRKIAILGDMLELGPYEKSGHTEVGQYAAKIADLLILVGERSKTIAESALEAGFPGTNISWFPKAKDASTIAHQTIQGGDVVLIKGSNSMHMDQIITALEGQD